ncbi:hypothetical protein [Rhizobium sp. GCM10022189]|uniref:hypothetical protein n=1 Tax=Rhizobium sp. GCM10022189 TaxID=3252654 RepID=UPI00361B42E1
MFGFSKPVVAGLAVLGLVLAIIVAGLLGIREIRSMLDAAAAGARELSDAKWTAEFEKANAQANKRIADQANATIQIQADAANRVNYASQQLEELRKRNAALPDGDTIGLSADRGRMLPD